MKIASTCVRHQKMLCSLRASEKKKWNGHFFFVLEKVCTFVFIRDGKGAPPTFAVGRLSRLRGCWWLRSSFWQIGVTKWDWSHWSFLFGGLGHFCYLSFVPKVAYDGNVKFTWHENYVKVDVLLNIDGRV